MTERLYYDDAYFTKPSDETDEHLRTMSAAMAFAVNPNNNEDSDGEEISAILTAIGFSDILTWDLDVTSTDTMGTVIARKEIDGTPLIAVMLRGDSYAMEWSSNVQCGTEGDPTGFSAHKGSGHK